MVWAVPCVAIWELIAAVNPDQDEAQEECQEGDPILHDGLWGLRYRSVINVVCRSSRLVFD